MKKRFPLVIFIIGIITLLAGGGFLAWRYLEPPSISDADYLVQLRTWTAKTSESLVWTFTEVGKGQLTTNNHQNDYDFLWALDGNQLKTETAWAYPLQNTFTYKLNRQDNTLELSSGDKTVVFTAVKPQ